MQSTKARSASPTTASRRRSQCGVSGSGAPVGNTPSNTAEPDDEAHVEPEEEPLVSARAPAPSGNVIASSPHEEGPARRARTARFRPRASAGSSSRWQPDRRGRGRRESGSSLWRSRRPIRSVLRSHGRGRANRSTARVEPQDRVPSLRRAPPDRRASTVSVTAAIPAAKQGALLAARTGSARSTSWVAIEGTAVVARLSSHAGGRGRHEHA